jgi:serine/threonine protein kinase
MDIRQRATWVSSLHFRLFAYPSHTRDMEYGRSFVVVTPKDEQTRTPRSIATLAASPGSIRFIIPLVVAVSGLLIAFVGQRTLTKTTQELTRARFQEETRAIAGSVGSALAGADPLLVNLHESILAYAPRLHLENDATQDAVLNAVAHEFAAAVRAHQGVVYASASFPDGGFLGAFVEADNVLRFQVSREPNAKTTERDELAPGKRRRYTLSDGLRVESEAASTYDPRKRSFYQLALQHRGRVWSKPYLFYDDHAPGITRTEAVYRGNEVVAVLTVDYNLTSLSKLVTGMQSDVGSVVPLLHTEDGFVLALPDALRPPNPALLDEPLSFRDVKSPLVAAFFSASPASRDSIVARSPRGDEDVMALSSEVPGLGEMHWFVTALVPESVHAKIVNQHRTRSIVALSAALGLSILLGAFIASYVQRAQKQVQAAQEAAKAAESRAQTAEGIAKKLGSYELVKCLGKGGMGEVWRAAHRLLPRDAAVKLIRPDFLAEGNREEVQMRFRREARSLAQLRCRNTVSILDYGVANDGALFLVMELLDGRDAEKMVRGFGPLLSERVVFLMIQVCRSLAEAHDLGLVHRDIKPANIFLSKTADEVDIVKVLDFGLVHDAHAVGTPKSPVALPADVDASRASLKASLNVDLTQQGASMGTPSYMAPEQVLGHAVTPATDVYGLGCVMVYLLTGRKLYQNPDAVSQMMAHVVEPTPEFETWAKIPPALATLIRACLEKDAAKRPEDGRALLTQLEQLESTLDTPWTAPRARLAWDALPKMTDEDEEISAAPIRLSIDEAAVTRAE